MQEIAQVDRSSFQKIRADSLAKVGVSEKRTIRDMFKGAGIDTTYNEIRWGDLDEF